MHHCFRLNEWLGAGTTTNNVFPDDRRNGFKPDSAIDTILGLEPSHECLGTFAGVAATATQGNVFVRDDLRIIDDVLPRRTVAKARLRLVKGYAAIDTTGVSVDHLFLECSRNVPTIQANFPKYVYCGRLTCELTGAVGHDGVWGRMKWSPKRRHAPLLPVERMVRLHAPYRDPKKCSQSKASSSPPRRRPTPRKAHPTTSAYLGVVLPSRLLKPPGKSSSSVANKPFI